MGESGERRDGSDGAIVIQNLTKRYGRRRGVEEISLFVERGDIFGFLGQNGAGKSTTIRCMLGLLHFGQGQIRLLGQDVGSGGAKILRHVGYMPSEAMFYPSMRVEEVIAFAERARRKDCGKEADRLCGILSVDKKKRIGELSLGNRRKVSIVCAMMARPEILVMDEPSSGLDPLMQEAFFDLLRESAARGTTCFLSSHVLTEVKRYCRHAAIIREGRLVLTDSVEHLMQSGLRYVKVRAAGEEKRFSWSGSMRELIHRLEQMEVEDVLIEEPSLDEIFLHYYQQEGGKSNHDAVMP